MIFDVDAGNALLAWSDNFSFQPAWFAGTDRLVNGQQILDRPHIVIKLSIPVSSKNKRAMTLFNAVYNEIRNRLIADGCTVDAGQKPVTKNPDSGFWDVRSRDLRCWTLHELAEALGLHADDRDEKITTTQFSANPAESRMGLSRNCDAFEIVRLRAYAFKSSCQSRQEMLNFVGLEVTTHNATLPRPMKVADVKSITKSVANWTWEFYTGSGKAAKSRGRMVDCIDQDDSLTLRKQKSAYYSASVNAAATYQKAHLAYTEIAARGEIPTQSQVVKLSGVSRSSIVRYWSELKSGKIELNSDAGTKLELLKAGVSLMPITAAKPTPTPAAAPVVAPTAVTTPTPLTTATAIEPSTDSNVIPFARATRSTATEVTPPALLSLTDYAVSKSLDSTDSRYLRQSVLAIGRMQSLGDDGG